MQQPAKVTDTEFIFSTDAVCVLYAKAKFASPDGVVTESPSPICGIFQTMTPEFAQRIDEHGFSYVYVWSYINDVEAYDFDEEWYWIVLKVPPNGLIELPDYTGEVISRIHVS